jgi:TPR repeat protein
LKYYQLACENEIGVSCNNLADMIKKGKGCKADDE